MTLMSEHQMGCAADLGPSAAGTRLANHAAAEGACRRVHRHQPRTPPETRGFDFPSAHGETPAGAGIWMALCTPSGVGDGAVSVTGRTAVPAAA